MSKRQGVFTEHLPSFFQMQKKLKTWRNSNLRDFGRSSLRDSIHVKLKFSLKIFLGCRK